MKKLLCLIISVACVFSLAACGNETVSEEELNGDTDTATTTSSETKAQVDLTTLSSTMVYSEVSNMMQNPQTYVGKKVKMKGKFAVAEDNGKNYYACIIADATACCQQGIEFELAGEHTYPNDYPQLGSEITVYGTFKTYKEGEQVYLQLSDATLL